MKRIERWFLLSSFTFVFVLWNLQPPLLAQEYCFPNSSKGSGYSCSSSPNGMPNTQPVTATPHSPSGMTTQPIIAVAPNEEEVLSSVQTNPGFTHPRSTLEASAKVETYDPLKNEGRVTIKAMSGNLKLPSGMVAYLYLLDNTVTLWGVEKMTFGESGYTAGFTGPAGEYRAVVEIPEAGAAPQKILAFSIGPEEASAIEKSAPPAAPSFVPIEFPTGKSKNGSFSREVEAEISAHMNRILRKQPPLPTGKMDLSISGRRGPAYYHHPGTDPETAPVTGGGENASKTSRPEPSAL